MTSRIWPRPRLASFLTFLAVAASLQVGRAADAEYKPAGQHFLADIGSNTTACPDDLVVRTSLFTYQGAVSDETPTVRQFLGIPFAEPPVGPLRFRPPVTKRPLADGAVVDATKYGSYCFQHDNGVRTFYAERAGHAMPEDLEASEDCLTLDVWTARHGCDGPPTKKAVLIWIHGGALMTGGSASPYMRGNRLVARFPDDVVVVSINYRLNIFGFPRAGALDGRHLNPAFLDVRMAVQWVYNNIGHFGGDPNRMVLFGNSAGGSHVDKYAYAWAHDPLVQGYICMSGQGEFTADPRDVSNFTYVAAQVGCASDTDDYDAEFQCMQNVPAPTIMAVLNGYDSRQHGGRVLGFQPQSDNETSFGNYTDLQVRGLYSRLPTVIGNVDNEMASLYYPWTGEPPDQETLDLLSGLFVCPAAVAAKARQVYGAGHHPTWRYRYFGVFPNMNPLPWMRAYHGSEFPMVFGTADTFGGPNTPAQDALSAYMQTAWVAFAKDPQKGLLDLGWPLYVEDEATLVRLGHPDVAAPAAFDLVQGDTYDGLCPNVMANLGDVVKRAMPP
ncbi:uncharacterized protein SPSK_00767 [Sporothrix schenckii 1099-18]|uniref:Carboxylic ester hydrolase n=1 Tax=Sporothrix schenckii 1099-18 TaxID=1397361 RepID=A0A0F2LXS2_SPOSC|nr:uncharacterized protein SPSK_00767 [Sporothrix schenckii 1099-18]KJR81634.1 hypothetical protein SPSK_00767 [Sporothrix schenckii 1099-18]